MLRGVYLFITWYITVWCFHFILNAFTSTNS